MEAWDLPYVKEQIIVKFKKSARAQEKSSVKNVFRLTTKRTAPIIGAELMQLVPGASLESTIKSLLESGLVEYAQPNYIYYPAAAPNDTKYNQLWGLHNAGQTINAEPPFAGTSDIDIDAPEAWEQTAGNLEEVVVAVIDSGTDINHPDLAGKIWTNPGEIAGNGIDDDKNGYADDIHGWDFYNNDNTVYDAAQGDEHGTHVSGTIAAVTNNNLGVAGVASNVKIMPLKFIGPAGGDTMSAVEAINYAAGKGVKVSNNSWGCDASQATCYDQALNDAIKASNMVFVAASGNGDEEGNGLNNDTKPVYPSSLPASNIISVAAMDANGALAKFSNYGATTVDVGAPGVDILSTYPKLPDLNAAVFNTTSSYNAATFGFGLETLEETDAAAIMNTVIRSYFGLSPRSSTSILLVNDGEIDINSVSKRRPDFSEQFQQALHNAGYTSASGTKVTTVTVNNNADGPAASTLQNYDIVIWFTGWAYGSPSLNIPPITSADKTNLSAYLNSGGKLLLTGEDALIGSWNSEFVTSKLGVKVEVDGRGGYTALSGADGTLFAGSTFQFAENSPYNDVLNANVSSAQTVLQYKGEADYANAYRYADGTSMAAPHVAGIAGVLMGQKNLSAVEAINLIKDKGVALTSLAGKTSSGKMANLFNAVATQVTQPAVEVGNPKMYQPSQYKISFNVGAYGKLTTADRITVQFPQGTSLPVSIPADKITVNGIAAGESGVSIPAIGQTLTFAVPITVDHNGSISIVIHESAGIKNPNAGTEYQLTVNTTADPVQVQSAYFAIAVNPTILYDLATFKETSANDGTVTSVVYGELLHETFTGVNGEDYIAAGKAAVINLPEGLNAAVTKVADKTVSVSVYGQVYAHTDADDVDNLIVGFKDAAFAGGSAAKVYNAVKGDFKVDFWEPLQAPANLAAVQVNTSIQLTWSKVTGAAKYEVYRSADGKNFKSIAQVNAGSEDTMSYTDLFSAGPVAKQYWYKVKALGGVKDSDLTAAANVVVSTGKTHFFGNVALNGASKDGINVRIRDTSGTVDLTAAYGQHKSTVSGDRYGVSDKTEQGGEASSTEVQYYFEVPNGTYTITAWNGKQTAEVSVTTEIRDFEKFDNGLYNVQPVSNMTLSEAPKKRGGGGVAAIMLPPQQPEAADDGNGVTLGKDAVKVTKETTTDGKQVTKVTLDAGKLGNAFGLLKDKAQGAQKVILDLGATENIAKIEIPGHVLADAAQSTPGAVLEIRSDTAGYNLPVNLLDLKAFASELGAELKDVKVNVTMEQVTGAEAEQFESKAKEAGVNLIGSAIEFTITVEADGKSQEANEFGQQYVTRTIAIPQAVSSYQASAVMYDPATGEISFVPAQFVTENGHTRVVIKRNGNSIYSVIESSKSFPDLDGHWAKKDVELLASKLILSGTTDTAFTPNKEVTRAEFAAMIVRALGLKENKEAAKFSDVSSGQWFAGAVGAAAQSEIVTGFEDGEFKPNEKVTREQMAVMISRAMKFAGKPAEGAIKINLQSKYKDGAKISTWAQEAVLAANEAHIVTGRPDGSFAPGADASRAEAATMLKRLLAYLEFIN
ncbi:S8 family serine peptidase [Paenibacillus alkalitolerans]|uniref:S8 family serine peptidase n=1 Tax=Paenibacillus alkalitolerans TaxID=2799335 RepID=UPI0018F77BBC|nr:S8 family serine peptidase [Paenibacillus alkalitolerans]